MMEFYLEEKYSILGTSYYLVFRKDGICYGSCTSPWEYLREKLRRGTKFKIVEKPIKEIGAQIGNSAA